jgi:CDP-diacylglycerol--glycerol-3-phosphate 3-phosphatidyltransferase
MKGLSDGNAHSGKSDKNLCSTKSDRGEALTRLRHQSWLAAAVLFFPWVVTIIGCWPAVPGRPAAIIGFLPGLAAAIHIAASLFVHLRSNHVLHQQDQLFPTLGAANWITLLRGSAVVALAGLLPLVLRPDTGQLAHDRLAWASGGIYLTISLLDLLDGYLARMQGRQTELGKHLDIATDAAGLLAASLVAVALGRLPVIYLLVGLAYYPFILGIWLRQKRGLSVAFLQSRPYARIIAGCQMGLVAMALLPIFSTTFAHLAAYIFMTPLLIGFVRDWLVVSCRFEPEAKKQSRASLWLQFFITRYLPLILRLILLAGGIAILTGTGGYQIHLSWQIAAGFCCLLAAIGCMGRIAGLLLMLLFGCNLSPFGTTAPFMTLFSSAAALLLSGTGTMSLWAPEEMILYRRSSEEKGPNRHSDHSL